MGKHNTSKRKLYRKKQKKHNKNNLEENQGTQPTHHEKNRRENYLEKDIYTKKS